MKYVLVNPLSCNGEGHKNAESYISTQTDAKTVDITSISDYKSFFEEINEADDIVICGGDGTLNRFVNNTDGIEIKNNIYFYPCGTGNDFYSDVNQEKEEGPILINKYLENLPTVKIKGDDHKFINGVGYGIDGYCCEIGDKLHAEGKPADYTMIAIKGLLFHYKPTNATVIVDGVEHKFKKVWIAPTMNGRKYGGGMIPTPAQERISDDKKLSVMLFHGSSKLKTLIIFPSLFKGEHVKKAKNVTILTGKNITVKFDGPRPLQIDGETVLGVEEYTASV